MGNCHKNRICQFVHHHQCLAVFVDCCQGLFSTCCASIVTSCACLWCGACSTGSTVQRSVTYSDDCCDQVNYYSAAIGSASGSDAAGGGGGGNGGNSSTGGLDSVHHSAHCGSKTNIGPGDGDHCSGCPLLTTNQHSHLSHRHHHLQPHDLPSVDNMHRQRSASHCPHQSQHQNKDRKCCCRQQINPLFDPLSLVASSTASIGQSQKRASSLRVLNKRFNFSYFNDNNADGQMTSSDSHCNSFLSRCNSRKHKHKHKNQQNANSHSHHHQQNLRLNDLNDRCLLAIFEYFSLQEKLQCERVCRKWQRLVRTSLQAPASLKIGEHSVKCNCQCAHYPSWDLPPSKRFTRDNAGYIIYPNSILLSLLTLCSNLRCINFSHCYLDDRALQIIMDHSAMIECLHLNDIRLDEDTEVVNGNHDSKTTNTSTTNPNSSDELLSNGHSNEDTISAAVGAFATEQLAVFGGLMRKLSTRKPSKKGRQPRHSASITSVTSKKSSASSTVATASAAAKRGVTSANIRQPPSTVETNGRGVKVTTATPTSNNSRRSSPSSGSRPRKPIVDVPSGTGSTTVPTNRSSPVTIAAMSPNSEALKKCDCCRHDSRSSLETSFTKTSISNLAASFNQNQHQQAQQHRRATQRRREWSRHRSSGRTVLQKTEQDPRTTMASAATDSSLGALVGDENNSSLGASSCTINIINNNNSGNGGNGSGSATTQPINNAGRRHLSPNVAPNISSLQTDSDGVRCTSNSNSSNSSNSLLFVSTGGNNSSHHQHNRQARQHHHQTPGDGTPTSVVPTTTVPNIHNNNNNTSQNNHNLERSTINRYDDIQAFVEHEQRRRECRQTHLLQWKKFAKKLGAQIRCLSIGGLSSVDQIVIDLLLKYCVELDELRINNELDILSYLTIIKHTVKRIYINCEHGIGLECVSLLAFRNYAEKVINLGRVDVPPELIDSVISTIGSNFSNLRTLHLRLHNFDIDVATPASLLFDNLYELNLQFVSGNVDTPFKKFIQLGWSSVRCLTIQYASITEESVRAIGENMPQLKKLVLHAIEFRCDHLGRRYGHRICTNCSHTVWKCITTLPYLAHLKLHRVIIDDEICKALCRMTRLTNLDLHYCSNVNDNVIGVCVDLAKRNPKRRFTLSIVSRGLVNFKPPTDCINLFIDVKVACK